MKIADSVTELIGKTPLLRFNRIEQANGIQAMLLVKPEGLNPAGSAKDRVALQMILDAEKEGRLSPGAVIIEPTSGNTGIGLAAICAAKGYQATLVMPDTMSKERRQLLSAYGAKIVLSPGAEGMNGAITMAKELQSKIPGSMIAGQFENVSNPRAHRNTTAPEIWEDTDGKVDIFVAGIGTGGTITGVGGWLKERNPDVRVVGFEPASSPLLTKGYAGAHGLQGIGANFVPDVLDRGVIDEILTVTEEDAFRTAREVAHTEGLLTGITSGAAVFTALELAKRPENRGKVIVALLPDHGDRYLSSGIYD